MNETNEAAAQNIENFETAEQETFSFPSSMTATVKFGYETSMRDQLENLETDFHTYIDKVMAHVQTYYKEPSLTTQVNFEVLVLFRFMYICNTVT